MASPAALFAKPQLWLFAGRAIVSAPAAISQKYPLSSPAVDAVINDLPRAERGASVRRTGLKDGDEYRER